MKKNKLSYSIARVISTLFVPPTFTVFLFTYLVFLIENNYSNQLFIFINTLIFGFILPIYVFFKMRKSNKISDFDTSIKEEREIPYIINSIFCLTAIPQLLILGVDKIFVIIWILLFINQIVLYFINRKWKISIHLIWAAIPLGALLFLEGNINYILIGIIIIIGWSRIKIGIHDLKQVIAGGMLGFLLTYFILNITYNYIL